MAPTHATPTLACLEENLHEMIGIKYCNVIKEEFTKSWKRYLNDWMEMPMGNLQRITQPTTKLNPRNKIYNGTQLKRITVLDILIKNEHGQIITDIYHKQTNTQQYLHFKSHHPKICIKSIPYTLARRINTIITDKNLKKHSLKNYTQPYTKTGYPTTLIKKMFELVEPPPPQKKLRTQKNKMRNP